MKTKILALLLVTVMMIAQVGLVGAQAGTPPSQLTPQQMKNAVVIADGFANNRLQGKSQIYRLASCDGTTPNTPCYLYITGDGKFPANGANTPSSILPLASSATITCGQKIYDALGIEGATLKENIRVTFSGTYGMTPVTLNSGNLNGTSTYHLGWTWSALYGPTPSPGWGVNVARTGNAYSTAGGNLLATLGGQSITTYYSTNLRIYSGGWYCY